MLGKHFIDLQDVNAEDLREILNVAHFLKSRHKQGVLETVLAGKTLAMLFEKPSLRTRVSFEVGMSQLGGRAMYLSKDEVGLGQREAVSDVAQVLSRYVDGIMVRTFAHKNVTDLAEFGSVPVINGLSDDSHPCQAIADLLSIEEHLGSIANQIVVFIGDANNVSISLARACALAGSSFVLACPQAYAFDESTIAGFGAAWGTTIRQVHDPKEAVSGATVLYTDVWTSMGQEAEREKRLQDFAGYQINHDLLAASDPSVKVLHCLPAHRGEEITAEVMDDPCCVVFDQAENRMHAQKAIMRLLMADDRDQVIAQAQAFR